MNQISNITFYITLVSNDGGIEVALPQYLKTASFKKEVIGSLKRGKTILDHGREALTDIDCVKNNVLNISSSSLGAHLYV